MKSPKRSKTLEPMLSMNTGKIVDNGVIVEKTKQLDPQGILYC